MATCSVPVSCFFKMKYYHLQLNKSKYLFLHVSKTQVMPVPPSLGILFNIFNCIFCPVQLQMVIFDFKEEGTGTKHVAIATSKCLPSGIFLRMQHPCQVSWSIALLHDWWKFCVTPLYSHNWWCHQWLNLHNRKTWISLEQKKISQKEKCHFTLLWKAF